MSYCIVCSKIICVCVCALPKEYIYFMYCCMLHEIGCFFFCFVKLVTIEFEMGAEGAFTFFRYGDMIEG